MEDKMIAAVNRTNKSEIFTIQRISNELKNQANCILSNSQFLLDVWDEIFKVLYKLQMNSNKRNIFINDLPIDELKVLIPKIIRSNIKSSGRINGISNILEGIEQFDESIKID